MSNIIKDFQDLIKALEAGGYGLTFDHVEWKLHEDYKKYKDEPIKGPELAAQILSYVKK